MALMRKTIILLLIGCLAMTISATDSTTDAPTGTDAQATDDATSTISL